MSDEVNGRRSFLAGIWQGTAGRMVITAFVAFIVGFFAGFLPAWSSERASQTALRSVRDQTQRLEMQTLLGSALADASRGSYEAARQSTSEFFSLVRAAAGEALFPPSVSLDPFFAQRDNLITLLARNDPASVPRLAELYVTFREMAQSQSEQQTTMVR